MRYKERFHSRLHSAFFDLRFSLTKKQKRKEKSKKTERKFSTTLFIVHFFSLVPEPFYSNSKTILAGHNTYSITHCI